MVDRLRKYPKLFLLLLKINYLKAMEYRLDFISAIIPTGVYSTAYIVFISLVLKRVPSITGWTFDQMLIFFAVEQFFYFSGWIFYRRSIDSFPTLIQDGTFDSISKLPVNTRFLISFRDQSPEVFAPFLVTIMLLIYAIRNLSPNLFQFIVFFLLVSVGIVILYNLFFTLASLSFWTTEADEFIGLLDEIQGFGKYPLSIFPGLVGLLLLTVIPIVLMVYVPATYIMAMVNTKLIILLLFILIISWIISNKIWLAGLRHYSSASS